jgi:hypothetical protein
MYPHGEIEEGYNNKLKNKLFGLLCEYEKNREWEKFLDAILVELMGFPEERRTINYYTLYFKVSSLRFLNSFSFTKICPTSPS